jgi:hypothetical protein
MAVLSVEESDGREVERGENMNRRITRSYRIRCDRGDEDEAVVLIGSGMPAILAPHPTVPQLRCTSVRIKQRLDNDPFVWDATVVWNAILMSSRGRGAAATSADPTKRDPNPLLRPAVLSFHTERFQRPVTQARKPVQYTDGTTVNTAVHKNLVNSAGDPFESPVMKDDFRPTITITKNIPFASWSVTEWRKRVNKVNLTPWLGLGVGEVKIADLTADEGFENDIPYYTMVGTFHVASEEDGDWLARPVDAGYQYIDGFSKKREIFLPGGTKPGSPVRLDGDGGVLNPPTAAAFYLEAEIYGYYEFSSLGFF